MHRCLIIASAAASSLALLCLPAPASAAKLKFKSKGEIGLATRVFYPDGESATRDWGLGLDGRIELKLKRKPFRAKIRAFGRLDTNDAGRNVVFLEEAWAQWKWGDFELRAGADLLNWSATEAFHPADVFNARNLDSNIEKLEKLGEPAVSLSYKIFSGTLRVWYRPYVVDPVFPSRRSRQNFAPPGTPLQDAIRVGRDGKRDRDRWQHQWTARLTQSIGKFDLGVHALQHVDRQQPGLRFQIGAGGFDVRPIFLFLTQLGGTMQADLWGVLLKVEAAYRWFEPLKNTPAGAADINPSDHAMVAVGAEYPYSWSGGSETSFLVETQTAIGPDKGERALLGPFQRDLLVGARHAFNDEMSREFLISYIVDLEREEEMLLNFSYTQRLGDQWSLTSGLRVIWAPPEGELEVGEFERGQFPRGLEAQHEAHQLFTTITRFF